MNTRQVDHQPKQALFEFFEELFIIHQLAASAFNKVMPHGLHVSHFAAINHLINMGDGRTPVQMAGSLQVTKATMTHTLNVLQTHRLIEVRPNHKDRRSKLVFLTERGRAFQQEAIAALSPTLKRIGIECGVAELSAALPILKKLRIFMDQERGSSR